MSLIEFENLESKFEEATSTKEWEQLSSDFLSAKNVYVLANGGLHYVSAHMAADCSRLIQGKIVHSFDSMGYITSIANDWGYENLFVKWLESTIQEDNTSLILGMSCSGNSKNITRALMWARNNGYNASLISGKKSKRLEWASVDRQSVINEVCFDTEYFHTCEILCMMSFYQLIHEAGSNCPKIIQEIERKDPWAV